MQEHERHKEKMAQRTQGRINFNKFKQALSSYLQLTTYYLLLTTYYLLLIPGLSPSAPSIIFSPAPGFNLFYPAAILLYARGHQRGVKKDFRLSAAAGHLQIIY